jgi:outer membrane protein insertion porin family
LDLREGPHVYIDQIIITGNERTNEDVIRREIRLFEGDAYDTSKLKESKRRIRNLGFFKKVTIKKEPSDNADKVNLIIAVKEEPHTGELSLSGGFSTVDGPLVGVQLSEHNLQGKGQEIRAKIEVAKRRQEFDIGFTEPYFLNRSLSAGFDIFSISRQKFFESSFDQRTYGLRLRAGYELAENLQQTWSYKINRERVTGVSSKASEFIREQEGWATESTIGHSLIYDRRNTRFDPTSGFYVGMDNSFIGVGGDIRLLGNSLFGGYFYSPYEGWILGLTGRAGIIMGLSQKVRVVDRYTLGGYSLRGFEIGGVGPRDKETGDLLGGLRYYKGTAELLFPSGLPNEFGLKWSVFTDFGSLWHSGDPSNDVLGTPAIRVSAGFGLSWSTPLGPIRLDFAWHVVKQKQDATRVFLFSIGPRF